MPKYLGGVLTAVAALVIVALVFTGEETIGERGDALAARLRCPVCQSESVADSASETAREMRALIDEQIATGASDDEIIAFFATRYGDWIILDAPASGRTLVLWVLPVAAAVIGGVVIAGRRRRATSGEVSEAALDEDRRDLQRQIEMGELDEAAAAALAETYSSERPGKAAAPMSPRLPRVLTGTAILLVGLGVVVFAVVKATDTRESGELLTGSSAAAAGDLTDVSNEELEAVIAANPDLLPMRLALARRYFNAGEFSTALPHYLYILEREANPEALASVGWMAYLSDEPATAATYLERSLEAAPDYTQAQWFLANVRMFGLDDPTGAEPLIRSVLATADLPPEVREEAERMLAEATS